MKKRLLSLLLALCLLAALLCSPAFAAAKPGYVALGDSIAAGYGLEGFAAVSGTPGALVYTVPEGCFAKLIAARQGYAVQNLAVSGDDTNALLARLKTAQYSDAVKSADLITLTIGSNDILVPVLNMIQKKFLPDSTDHADLATPGKGNLLDGDLTQMMATLQSVNDYLNSAEVTGVLDKAVVTFRSNWDTIVDTLLTLNPDVQLIVTSYYHPYSMMDISFGSLNLNVGTLGYRYLNQLNAYIKDNARNGKSYTIVDVTAASTNVKLDTAAIAGAFFGGTADLSAAVNLDPHPDAAGHAYIAAQIVAALNAAEAAKTPAFADVKADSWYAVPAAFAAQQKLIVGDQAGNFNPTAPMTLAQYMTMLYRYARAAAPEAVPEQTTTGANWMEAAQYMNDQLMGGRYIDLGQNMTRFEMAEITASVMQLVTAATGKAPNTRQPHGFADVTGIESVQYLESVYGVDGYAQADGTYLFKGDALISRAEVAQVVYNIMTKSAA